MALADITVRGRATNKQVLSVSKQKKEIHRKNKSCSMK